MIVDRNDGFSFIGVAEQRVNGQNTAPYDNRYVNRTRNQTGNGQQYPNRIWPNSDIRGPPNSDIHNTRYPNNYVTNTQYPPNNGGYNNYQVSGTNLNFSQQRYPTKQ